MDIKFLVLGLGLTTGLVACGGGGSSSDTVATTPATTSTTTDPLSRAAFGQGVNCANPVNVSTNFGFLNDVDVGFASSPTFGLPPSTVAPGAVNYDVNVVYTGVAGSQTATVTLYDVSVSPKVAKSQIAFDCATSNITTIQALSGNVVGASGSLYSSSQVVGGSFSTITYEFVRL